MNGSVPGQQLRAFIERIERLEEERRTIADDIKEVKAEAKGWGFDVATINAIIKLRKKDANERAEEEALLDIYMAALGMLPLEEAARRSYAEEKGREPVQELHELGTVPNASVDKASSAETDDLGTTSFDSETGEITETQESVQPDRAVACEPAERSSDKRSPPIPHPRPASQAAVPPADAQTGAGSANAPARSSSDDEPFEPPAFLREQRPLRPHCLHPELCASGTRDHCHTCKRAMAEREVA